MELELSAEERERLDVVKRRLADFSSDRSRLIPILQMVQETVSYLPSEAIELVADHLNLSPSEVYGVATFYNQFRFTPPGRHPVKVCLGTACHVRGGEIILENFARKLGIDEGQTTADREFSIERVACVGCCALAPVALIGETVHGNMAPSKVEGLLLRIDVEKEMAQREQSNNEPERN